MMDFSKVPKELAHLNVFLRCATDHSQKDPIVTYYCLLHAFQKGLGTSQKSPAVKTFLSSVMDHLEELKKNNSGREEIMSETIGIPYVEQYALKLFSAAHEKDLNVDFGAATVKLFLTAATLLDIVSGVGEVGDDIEKARKHAKWKAVYISKCLKSGKVPVSGPVPNTDAASIPSISGLGKADNFFSNSLNVPTVSVPEPYSCAPEQPSKPDLPSVSGRISPNKWFDIEKEIKYALSASNYQDEVTTEKHLIRALTLLRGKTEKY